MDKDKLHEQRNYVVAKQNAMIQRARFDLGITEQKLFCYIVSKIKPTDTYDMRYTFTINDFCDVCGIRRNSGRKIEAVKEAVKNLSDKSFWVDMDERNVLLCRWLSEAKIDKGSGTITVKLGDVMQEYLIGLAKDYTQYSLLYILPMRSTYSIRLYELLKSHVCQMREVVEYSIEDLKSRLMAPYPNFKDFRVRVLEPALREINDYTDIEFRWEAIKHGRKVVSVRFFINHRQPYGEGSRFENALRAESELNN